MEEGKKKNLLPIIGICALVVVIIVVVVLVTQKNNNEGGNTNSNSSTSKNSYVGDYGHKVLVNDYDEEGNLIGPLDADEDGNQDYYYETLHLRNDGSFYLSIDNYYANMPSVGTYTINDDNTITLKETVTYGSDACFFKDDLKTYTLVVKDKNTISGEINGSTIEFTKGVLESESKENLAYYVTNPVNGETAEGNADAWIDCSDNQSR